jgi:hypothetical protein
MALPTPHLIAMGEISQRRACPDHAVMGETSTFLPLDMRRDIETYLCKQSLTRQNQGGNQPVAPC